MCVRGGFCGGPGPDREGLARAWGWVYDNPVKTEKEAAA